MDYQILFMILACIGGMVFGAAIVWCVLWRAVSKSPNKTLTLHDLSDEVEPLSYDQW